MDKIVSVLSILFVRFTVGCGGGGGMVVLRPVAM